MLPALAVAVGLVWFFSTEAKRAPKPEEPPKPEDPPVDGDKDGDGIVEFEEVYSWSPEATVEDETVWTYQAGIIREDGSRRMGQSYVVIGNSNHTAFQTSNSSRGSITIPKEAFGGDRSAKNVIVYSSVQAAVDKLEEEDDDPNRPELPPP